MNSVLCVCGRKAVTKLPVASGEAVCAECATMFWDRLVFVGATPHDQRIVPLPKVVVPVTQRIVE